MKKIITLLALFCVVVFAQSKGTLTDSRDDKKYKIVKIGTQIWMAQNLDYHGEDGFLGLCYGDEPKKKIKKPENCKKYGRLYNWDEAMKSCPDGWHLPSDDEWQTIDKFTNNANKLKAKKGWDVYDFSKKSPKNPKCKWTERTEERVDNRGRILSPAVVIEHDECITDEYGFSALPGGYGLSVGYFTSVGYGGYWWSSSEYNSDYAYYRSMYYNDESAFWDYDGKTFLFSVRCLQD